MNILLGFGSTEVEFENQECSFVDTFLKEHLRKDDFSYITDEIVDELKKTLSDRAEGYKKKDEEYKTAENYPDRYSYYWFRVLHDFSDVCVLFKFHHINRRHALSRDGWALWPNKRIYHFDAMELR